jgi:hypothetical protein
MFLSETAWFPNRYPLFIRQLLNSFKYEPDTPDQAYVKAISSIINQNFFRELDDIYLSVEKQSKPSYETFGYIAVQHHQSSVEGLDLRSVAIPPLKSHPGRLI